MPRALKSTAKLWAQSTGPNTKYRDRKRVPLPDGTKKDVVGYGPTKQAATDDLYRKADALMLEHPSASTITVRQLFAEFLQHKKSVKGRKGKTIFDDAGLFARHLAPLADKQVSAVTLTDMQRIQVGLVSASKYRTAELATILLKSLFRFASKRYRAEIKAGSVALVDIDDLDAVRRPPGATKKAGELWTLEQVNAFLELAEGRYSKTLRSLLYPLFYTAITAGLRRGELLGLKRTALKAMQTKAGPQAYLDVTEQLVYYGSVYHPDTPKTEMGVRKVPVSPALEVALKSHMHKLDVIAAFNARWKGSGLMFPNYDGGVSSPRNIYRTRDQLIDALGLPHSTLHQMRKVFTSYITRDLIQQGRYSPKLVQKLLGHARPDVAMSVYTLVIDEDYMGATFSPRGLQNTPLDISWVQTSNEEDGDF